MRRVTAPVASFRLQSMGDFDPARGHFLDFGNADFKHPVRTARGDPVWINAIGKP